jgi:hypothetical protein
VTSADWATVASLATALGTLVPAVLKVTEVDRPDPRRADRAP